MSNPAPNLPVPSRQLPLERLRQWGATPANWLSIRTSVTAFCLLAVAGLAGIIAVWQYGNHVVATAFNENQRYVAAVGAAYRSRETNDSLAQAVQNFRSDASPQAAMAFEAAASELLAYLASTRTDTFGAEIAVEVDQADEAGRPLGPAFLHVRALAAQLGLGDHTADPVALPTVIRASAEQFARHAEALNSAGNAMAFTRIMAQVPKLNATIREFMSFGDARLTAEIDARFTAVQRAISAADLDDTLSAPLVADLQAFKTAFTNWGEASVAFRTGADQLLGLSASLNGSLLAIREKLAAAAATEARRLDAVRRTTDRRIAVIMVSVGSMIVAFAVLLIVGVVRPLHRVRLAVLLLAAGHLDVDLQTLPHRHELGSIAQALLVFRSNALAHAELEQAQASERERAGETQRRQEMHGLADLFEKGTTSIAVDIATAVTKMRDLAALAATGSGEIKEQVHAANTAADNSSHMVDAVANAAEKLKVSFLSIKNQIAATREVARSAAADATRASDRIVELASSVSEINGVSGLIHKIAEQTNLLALNATIEAARAGEAGKGFAVVASEVKVLASQTALATDEISRKVSNISVSTGGAAEAIRQINAQIEHVQQYAASVVVAIEQQWDAMRDIAQNTESAAANVAQIHANVETVELAADVGLSSANGVLGAATELVSLSDQLREQIGEFLNHVRDGQKNIHL